MISVHNNYRKGSDKHPRQQKRSGVTACSMNNKHSYRPRRRGLGSVPEHAWGMVAGKIPVSAFFKIYLSINKNKTRSQCRLACVRADFARRVIMGNTDSKKPQPRRTSSQVCKSFVVMTYQAVANHLSRSFRLVRLFSSIFRHFGLHHLCPDRRPRLQRYSQDTCIFRIS